MGNFTVSLYGSFRGLDLQQSVRGQTTEQEGFTDDHLRPRFALHKLKHIPESVAAMSLGFVVGCAVRVLQLQQEEALLNFRGALFFYVLLPPIILEAGLSLKTQLFVDNLGGTGSGLDDQDGLLMLHLFGQLAFLRTPIVLLEQVAGFRNHHHYDIVEQAWKDSGYREVWSGVSDLIEFSPVTRKRFLIVLVHLSMPAHQLMEDKPVLPPRPTLGSFDCILELPWDVEQACTPSKEALSMYLDPWYMPPSRHAHAKPQSPASFRFRGLSDRATCFMAQYHYQHELSPRALEKAGLYGVLLHLPTGLRFFSGAEIALMHGAVCPVWLSKDDRCQMRHLGNSLSPLHAVTPLALAFQLVGPKSLRVSNAQAILQCLSMRYRASQVNFLEFRDGWVLYKVGEAFGALVETFSSWVPRQQLPGRKLAFHRFELFDDTDACQLLVAPDVHLPVLFAALGHELPDECFEQLDLIPVPRDLALPPTFTTPGESSLQLDFLPSLPFVHRQVTDSPEKNLLIVIGRKACYFLDRESPLFFWEMGQAMSMEGWQRAEFFEEDVWCNLEGHRIKCRDDLQGTVSFHIADALAPDLASLNLDCLQSIKTVRAAAPPQVRIVGPQTLPLCKGFPFLTFAALGWNPVLQPQLRGNKIGADLTFSARHDCFRVPETHILPAFARFLLASLLREMERIIQQDATVAVPCKVQVEGRTFWQGRLPAALEFSEMEDLWSEAHRALGLVAPVRVYSGPRQVPPEMTLQHASLGPVPPGFLNRAGWLLISYMPETRGGGAKDVKFKSAQTDLAQFLLEQGLSLGQTTATADKLLPLAGTSRVQRVLDLTDGANRWHQLAALCKQFSVPLPELPSAASKAASSTASEALRRRAKNEPRPTAADFSIQPGFFRNADDSPATVLTQLMPGASGVYMCDAVEAGRILKDWTGTSTDELGLVILGHSCPDPGTCQGAGSTPAITATGHQVLLHTCWHNMGKSPLHARCENDASIILPDSTCVCATAFQDEFSAAEWQHLTANPVRAVSEKLRTSGSSVTLEAPWGRSFRKNGKASSSSDCESVQFHCRIQTSDLLQLLRFSGHAQVYLTPKTWQGEIAKGFAVVWAAGDREDVIRLSLQVPDPLGIVRSKRRFGIRVAEANFETAWNIVRPNQTAPPKVDVTGLFKLLSAPPQVRGSNIQEWAKQMSWDVRPLRCLGPGQWLLGASGPPPSGLLSMNKQAVLVQAVEPRQQSKPVVRAGKLPRAPPSATSAPSEGDDPLTNNDPWRNYLASTGRAISVPAPGPRQAEPPNQQRFDQQENRLQKLEAGLEELRRGHTAVTQQLATTQNVVERQVQGDLSAFARDFQHQIQANAEQQRQAHTAHQMQMQTGIDEIKAMLADNRSLAQKRPVPTPGMGDEL
ncbi:Sodium/hydrogen exchanger 8 [Symbiodinium microadriaticum]|uniref:Sodium/hydrogen exchanger 8 n=1 Tax=Symbiodinium microadriaticum TaxID=2951 RepID=A0A1Q9EEG1_SYMMI|nr:Sodium/hydrogen exchanger 8 [Symbiodinium microadriaticum]